MGIIADNIKLTVQEAKNYARIDYTDDDKIVKMLISSAISVAEELLNNDFGSFIVDGDGDLIQESVIIPTGVKLGCLEYIAFFYDHRGEEIKGIPENVMRHWRQYILIPGF